MNHSRDIRLPGIVVIVAQPAVITGVGGDAVKTEFCLRGVEFFEQVMKREDAGTFWFFEHFAARIIGNAGIMSPKSTDQRGDDGCY